MRKSDDDDAREQGERDAAAVRLRDVRVHDGGEQTDAGNGAHEFAPERRARRPWRGDDDDEDRSRGTGAVHRATNRVWTRDVRRRLRVGIVAKEDVARAIRRRRRRRRGRRRLEVSGVEAVANGRKLLHDGEFRQLLRVSTQRSLPNALGARAARAISVSATDDGSRRRFRVLEPTVGVARAFRARALHAPIFVLDARAVDARCADITRG